VISQVDLKQLRWLSKLVATTVVAVSVRPSRHTLPDGGVLDVGEFDYRTAESVRLEGVGVKLA